MTKSVKTKTSQELYDQLFTLSRRIHTLGGISSLLNWDKDTYMPPGAAAARAEQMELIASIIHKEHTAPAYVKALSQLIDLETGTLIAQKLKHEQKAALREWRRDYLKLKALPKAFVEEWAHITSQASHVWAYARKTDSYSHFAPYLDRIIQLAKRKADFLGYEEHPYDSLVDHYEPEMTKAKLDKLFKQLKAPLTALVHRLSSCEPIDDSFLFGRFSENKQISFSHKLLEAMGYPKEHGRMDFSAHPFCMAAHATDNRLTTRLHHSSLMSNILTVLHEGGHSLYELGLPQEAWGSPMGQAVSMAIHESQSRWWETRIGLSKSFWKHFLPELQQSFPKQLKEVTLDRFYRAINRVNPDFIRVEADEVTYCLHVMLRYELEVALIEGSLAVRDLPAAWEEKMQNYLGITPPNNRLGCLQDMHWSVGAIGYFPTYALGNLYAAQFFEAFEEEHPKWQKHVSKGELFFVKDWLGQNIHSHGRTYRSEDLAKRLTKKRLSAKPYLDYLENKYGSIYH